MDVHMYNLYIFAQCMELTFGVGPCTTSNLHTALCRLPDQVVQRGQSGYEGELWLERCVQVLKRVMGDAVPHNPEQLMAQRLGFDQSLLTMANHMPGIVDITASLPQYCKDKQETVYIRQGPTSDVYLCGLCLPWSRVVDKEHPHINQLALLQDVMLNPHRLVDVWLSAAQKKDLIEGQVYVYPRAELAGQSILYSRLLTLAVKSESFWVLIMFDYPRVVPTVASVQYMFTLRNTVDATGNRGEFFAVVRMYKCSKLSVVSNNVKPVYMVKAGDYDESTRPMHKGLRVVRLSEITCKLHRFFDPTENASDGSTNRWYFQ